MTDETIKKTQEMLANITDEFISKQDWAKELLKRVQEIRRKRGVNRSKELTKLESEILIITDPEKNAGRIKERILEVHEEFIISLKEYYPLLTDNEILFCCYLRMNLRTDIIAALKEIDVKSVNMARYRLRKKLGLTEGQELASFLNEYQK